MNTINSNNIEEGLSPRERIIEELGFNEHTNFNRVDVIKVLSNLLKEKETEKNRIVDHASQILSKEGTSQIISEANARIKILKDEITEIHILLEELETEKLGINQNKRKVSDILSSK